MTRVFFASELEGVATWWRIERRDGITLGFTSHDRDMMFDGVLHRAAPGVLPSAIRKTSALDGDSAEMQGPLSHDSIAASDLAQGRFDGARVRIGAVDWETLERIQLYAGSIGTVSEEAGGFSADLLSAKEQLAADPVPRTSPTCRASFCGPGCTLSAARFTSEAAVSAVDQDRNAVTFAGIDPQLHTFGSIRWLDGPQIGLTMEVVAVEGDELLLDTPLDSGTVPGMRAILRQGCDHTLATCHARFANAANFRGEPFLPGNDLLARYPSAQ
ncbi:DUF2163 domain-containing protein [Erythrobacter sp. SDW2]|uniref:DUF2163 domain-containing protein n=1 Tax=Erythrobacter sp. SDW2 TaxID=2907154 RepID=UPI001F3E9061|nr:DUF2163 domain-containing protein [Erythrobacter sp. SDW2]UIP07142.1 DUF2163 domain-containing protein [Erythrobacter sp. SDW2]